MTVAGARPQGVWRGAWRGVSGGVSGGASDDGRAA